MIARTLCDSGDHPVMNRLPSYLSAAEGLESAPTADALLAGCAALRGVTHRLRDDGPLLEAFDIPPEHRHEHDTVMSDADY